MTENIDNLVFSNYFINRWEIYSIEFKKLDLSYCDHCKFFNYIKCKVVDCKKKYGFYLRDKKDNKNIIYCSYRCYRKEARDFYNNNVKENESQSDQKRIIWNNKIKLKNRVDSTVMFDDFFIMKKLRHINEYVANLKSIDYIIKKAFFVFVENIGLTNKEEFEEYKDFRRLHRCHLITAKDEMRKINNKIKEKFEERNEICRHLKGESSDEMINNNNNNFDTTQTQTSQNFWIERGLISTENHSSSEFFYVNAYGPCAGKKIIIL